MSAAAKTLVSTAGPEAGDETAATTGAPVASTAAEATEPGAGGAAFDPEPGLHDGIAGELYHRGPGISKSGLDLVHRSPEHYQYSREHPSPASGALVVGTAAHALILEPDTFDETVVIADPDMKRPSNPRKPSERWAELLDEFPGQAVITEAELEHVLGMAAALDAHPFASILLRPDAGPVEQTAYWYTEVEGDGVLCKCRPDKLNDEHNLAVDLKTTVDASWAAFSKSTANYRYHLQAAWYLHGLKAVGRPAQDFVFVAVEKTPPYGVGVYTLASEDIALSWAMAERDLARYARCLRDEHWPGYPEHIREMSLPKWTWAVEPEDVL